MCFSPTASFTAGAALSILGGVSIASTKQKTSLPFAAIPLLFGIQQIIEGMIWLSLHDQKIISILSIAFLFVSHVVWPTYIPFSIFLMERTAWRRRLLAVCIGVGMIVSIYFLYYLFTETIGTTVLNRCIAYLSDHFSNTYFLSPYTLATSISCMLSRHRLVNVFGIGTFVAGVVTTWFFAENFISVWCFFAAILSIIIYLHVLHERKKQLQKKGLRTFL